jgi:hypothetical protein
VAPPVWTRIIGLPAPNIASMHQRSASATPMNHVGASEKTIASMSSGDMPGIAQRAGCGDLRLLRERCAPGDAS